MSLDGASKLSDEEQKEFERIMDNFEYWLQEEENHIPPCTCEQCVISYQESAERQG